MPVLPAVLLTAALVAGSAADHGVHPALLVGGVRRLREADLRRPGGGGGERPARHPVPWGFAARRCCWPRSAWPVGSSGHRLTEAFSGYVDQFSVGKESHGIALWHGFSVPLLLSVAGPGGRGAAVLAAAPDREGAVDVPGGAGGRGGLPEDHACGGPAGRRGHRRHPARLAAPLPRLDPARGHRAARRCVAGAPRLARRGAAVRHAGPAAGRHHHGRGRLPGRHLARPAAGGDAGRRHRLRRGGAVPAARRARPRPHPDPGRDRDPGHLRAGAAQAAQVLHQPSAAGQPLVAARRRRHRRRRGVADRPGRLRCAGRRARVGGLLRGGLHVRVRLQHRQRHAGRHPGLGHPWRDLRAGRRRHRRGEPDLHPQPLLRTATRPSVGGGGRSAPAG